MKSCLDGVFGGVFLLALAILTLAVAMAAFDSPPPQQPHGTPFLPRRTEDAYTNWGQGRAPESNHCPPGTIRFETDEGLFLECLRGTN